MTEYSYNVNKNCIVQNGKFVAYVDVIDANRIVKLLNEQDKEIKRLKCINRQLEERLDKSIALDMSQCGDVE